MKRSVVLVALTAALLPERSTTHLKSPANRSSGRTSKRTFCSIVCIALALGLLAPLLPLTVAAEDEFAGGDGTSGNPYQVADWHHLDNVRGHLGDHFILLNDIDADTDGYAELAGPSANGGAGWQPIGTDTSRFTGSFDGCRHLVGDLLINRGSETGVGLFGVVGAAGSVERVAVVNCSVYSTDEVGGLVGHNYGNLAGNYATGSVAGYANIGGLVGLNRETVGACYATCDVSAGACGGGLVGQSLGTVANCYATGSAQVAVSDSPCGGLVGVNSGTVSNCYATGAVTAGVYMPFDMLGGLVGRGSGTVSDSFRDTQTSGLSLSCGGTGNTTAKMHDIETFTNTATTGLDSPWNTVAVVLGETNPSFTWNIVDGETYPFLSYNRVPPGWTGLWLETGWNMVSVAKTCTVEDFFGDKIEAIYTWDPEGKCCVFPTDLEPYSGYWVAVIKDTTILCRF